MELSQFDYLLPQHLIAQQPKQSRSDSRLMVLSRATDTIQHETFANIGNFFAPGDVLVVNNTKVVSARLLGRRATGAKVDMLVIESTEDKAIALVQTRRRPQVGEVYYFGNYQARVLERSEKGWKIDFAGQSVASILREIGRPPLPPYIKRKGEKLENFLEEDFARYQTVYAETPGAIAAPTAGLHFSTSLLDELREKGILLAPITLHVGPGTFLPIRTERVEEHQMASEHYTICETTAATINAAKREGRRIIAVGTTSCRTLEGTHKDGEIQPGQGTTDLYIYPGFRFRAVDALVTNFHLPKSTLLLLVSAFASKDKIFRAYEEAIAEEYRFYSYGDAMLIL